MTRFRFVDEGAHAPDLQDPLWQESQIFIWWDETRGIGGLHRLGQLPGERRANIWNGLMTAAGTRYRSDRHDLPLRAGDRGERGLSVEGHGMQATSERTGTIRFSEPDAEVLLDYEDFHPMCEVWEHGTGGRVEAEMAAAHFETSGRVTGTMRLGDERFTVDGTFHRDHSWGPRDWEYLRGHRWVVGVAGPEFSFSSAVMLGTRDLVSGGYVRRDGERMQATDVDIVVGIEPDNVTARTAVVTWTLADGDRVIVDCDAIGGWMFGHGEYLEADQIGRFTVRGTDIQGWCDIETSMNHRLHNQPVELAIGAALSPGISLSRNRIRLFEELVK